MRPPRNPFLLRAAEQIDDDALFLSLCEPGLLGPLPEDGLWDRRVFVRSSPGGGKTTLLRLFTPGPLLVLAEHGTEQKQTAELYRSLRKRGVFDATGPTVAAGMLSMGKYTPLDQLSTLDEARRQRAFLALLNARVLLAGLRAQLELAGRRYPDELASISVGSGEHHVGELELPADGRQVFEWARRIETQVARALSSLGPPQESSLPGADELSALELLGSGQVFVDGVPARTKTVILLDDVHRLSSNQRELLLDLLLTRRAPTPVWIAERHEALTPDELISSGARAVRDSVTVDVERYWRGPKRKNFPKLALGIADRRTALAADSPGSSFSALMQTVTDEPWLKILGAVEARLFQAALGRQEFSEWIESRVDRDATARERAISMRSLEVLIERELAATQLTLDVLVRDESALEDFERRRKDASRLNEAAELFLSREFDLPFYFGSARLAQLGFSNVDQFLEFSGAIFEELSSIRVLRRAGGLPADRQQKIIESVVKAMWDNLAVGVANGPRVRSLLDGMGQYCAERTYLPNAPYLPGVTGLALRSSDAEHLEEAARSPRESWQKDLGRMLGDLIANNFVSVQGSEAKGQRWSVYYLNRAWCVRYKLPLGYGGWQPTTPEQMWRWSQGDQVRAHQQMSLA